MLIFVLGSSKAVYATISTKFSTLLTGKQCQ
jgi:hypothetical protein